MKRYIRSTTNSLEDGIDPRTAQLSEDPEELASLAHSSSVHVRRAVAENQFTPQSSLVQLSKDKDASVRLCAVHQIDDIDALIQRVDDTSVDVRRAAAARIEDLNLQFHEEIIDAIDFMNDQNKCKLAMIFGDDYDILIKLAQDASSRVRVTVAQKAEDLDILNMLVGDENSAVSSNATKRLRILKH